MRGLLALRLQSGFVLLYKLVFVLLYQNISTCICRLLVLCNVTYHVRERGRERGWVGREGEREGQRIERERGERGSESERQSGKRAKWGGRGVINAVQSGSLPRDLILVRECMMGIT